MSQEANLVMKKFLTRIAFKTIEKRKYRMIEKVEVFFVFGSKVKSAMCDWIYGLKVVSKVPLDPNNEILRDLKNDIKFQIETFTKQSVCCTDLNVEVLSHDLNP